MPRAENLWLETDEDGWHLVVKDDHGHIHDFTINAVTDELVEEAAKIVEWQTEYAPAKIPWGPDHPSYDEMGQ